MCRYCVLLLAVLISRYCMCYCRVDWTYFCSCFCRFQLWTTCWRLVWHWCHYFLCKALSVLKLSHHCSLTCLGKSVSAGCHESCFLVGHKSLYRSVVMLFVWSFFLLILHWCFICVCVLYIESRCRIKRNAEALWLQISNNFLRQEHQ